jgi:biotin carboxyl carrier protein
MYHSSVNNSFNSDINPNDINWDIIEIKDGKFHILYGNQSFVATVLNVDYSEKSFTVIINQNSYEVLLKDKFDLLAKQLGFAHKVVKIVNDVKAPMSGIVIDIIVNVGDEIIKGDSVLILEAMKMENIIKAERDAVVKSISIQKGAAVDKNQILVEFE